MKKVQLPWMLATICLGLGLLAGPALGQRGDDAGRMSPNAAASQTVGTTEIDVTYGSPRVKGRTIFGSLVPWGARWRSGADEPTAVTVSADVVVEGQSLAAGTYALWIVPQEAGDWEVIFGTMVGWGTMANQSKAVVTVTVAPAAAADQENLEFSFADSSASSTTLLMRWATTSLPIRFGPG